MRPGAKSSDLRFTGTQSLSSQRSVRPTLPPEPRQGYRATLFTTGIGSSIDTTNFPYGPATVEHYVDYDCIQLVSGSIHAKDLAEAPIRSRKLLAVEFQE